MMSQVRGFFESFGASRFDNVNSPNNERIHNRAGFIVLTIKVFELYGSGRSI